MLTFQEFLDQKTEGFWHNLAAGALIGANTLIPTQQAFAERPTGAVQRQYYDKGKVLKANNLGNGNYQIIVSMPFSNVFERTSPKWNQNVAINYAKDQLQKQFKVNPKQIVPIEVKKEIQGKIATWKFTFNPL